LHNAYTLIFSTCLAYSIKFSIIKKSNLLVKNCLIDFTQFFDRDLIFALSKIYILILNKKEVSFMKKVKKIVISYMLTCYASLSFACDYPSPPKDLPDGANSNKEEMLAGVREIASYQDDMSAYLSCIEKNEIAATKSLTNISENEKKLRSELFNKKYNAAIETQIRTVEIFNIEIRRFKEKSK